MCITYNMSTTTVIKKRNVIVPFVHGEIQNLNLFRDQFQDF